MNQGKRIIFMGTPDIAAHALQSLIDAGYQFIAVISQPDRKVGRKQEIIPTAVKKVALSANIPVLQPERIGTISEEIRELQPDLILTMAFGQLVPESILSIPELGCINLHASLLPKLRGGAPIHKAIMTGETKTGITLMYMEKSLDSGDMIAVREVVIDEDDTTGDLHDKLMICGGEMIVEEMPSLLSKTNKRDPQNHELATYAPNIKREEEFITFDRQTQDVYNHIRGLIPWPGCYFKFQDKDIKIWQARPVTVQAKSEPGTIIENTAEGLVIATNDGAIKLMRLQQSGKKQMDYAEIYRGNGKAYFQVGERVNE
ncbi:MAG: methionyl-tRNA formyltransferase [Culicoidibacterales bacterium]